MKDTGFGGEGSDRAYHWGRMSERDAIVAWLRRQAETGDPMRATGRRRMADAIERGEHRREEEP